MLSTKEKERQLLAIQMAEYEARKGKVIPEPTVKHTVESIKKTYKDNPKNHFRYHWDELNEN